MFNMPKNKGFTANKGFTLIEMMMAVAIGAILVTIALPAYQDNVRKARRSDGMDALMVVQNLQERYRANNTSYGTLAQIGFTGTSSQEGHYTISIVGTPSATGFQVRGTGVGDQANDSVSSTCTLNIIVNAANPRGSKTPADCW